MGSILLPRPYQAQEHGTAATLRCSKLVMLVAVTAPAFLAAGALAQVQEAIPPVLSSGLHGTTTLQTSVIARPSQRRATQSLPDAASLPPTGSIGAGSDIRLFLESGVPEDLARAALRRAWIVDPAIRDFVGLSENFWDFSGSDAVRAADETENRLLSGSDKSATDLSKSGR
jgi:Protein of unknown function (DUF3306)